VRQNSSLDVTDYDDSPHRLGRSIDLFDRVRYRNSITDVENTPIRELKASPYKFRFLERKDKENKYTHEVQRANNRRHSSILPQQKKAENITSKIISSFSSKLREMNQTYEIIMILLVLYCPSLRVHVMMTLQEFDPQISLIWMIPCL
jgi:DUF1365 family protein